MKSNFRTIVKFSLLTILCVTSFSLALATLQSCDIRKSDSAGGTYVKPTVTRTGKFRKGYVRRNVNTDKNAIKNQNRSRYYYQTRVKYRRKKF
jgi:hypothetical protein